MTNEQHAVDLVAAFGEMSGMPFFKLDNHNCAAARLECGLRFELEYLSAADRLFLYVVLGSAKALTMESLVRQNVAVVAQTGFSFGLSDVQGETNIMLMASLPAAAIDVEQLGETACKLVNTARTLLSQTGSEPGGAASPGPLASQNWLNV